MGLELAPGSTVYFDTNIFVYALEDVAEYQEQISRLFTFLEDNACIVVTSELTLAECLVKPYKDNNSESIEKYEQYLQNSDYLKVEPVSRDILHSAASNRATTSNSLPDSIHLATAVYTGCQYFVTNDKGISSAENILLMLLGEV